MRARVACTATAVLIILTCIGSLPGSHAESGINQCQGLKAYWPLDSPSPTLDAAGHGLDLTAGGGDNSKAPTVSNADCVLGECQSFSNQQYYGVSVALGEVPSNGLTFSLWFYMSTVDQTQHARFFQFDEWRLGLGLRADGSENRLFALEGDVYVSQGWQGVDVGPVVANEMWHHVVWALEPDQNGQGKWYIWLNGALLDTPPKANIGQENTDLRYPVSAPAGQEETENWIGEHPNPSAKRGFVGRLDDMRMFSRVLSQAEVTEIFEPASRVGCPVVECANPTTCCNDKPGEEARQDDQGAWKCEPSVENFCEGLEGHWPLDASSPTLDATGNGLDLTAGGGILAPTVSNADCVLGECQSFSNQQYYGVSVALGEVPSNGLTFSLWFYMSTVDQTQHARFFQFDEWRLGLGLRADGSENRLFALEGDVYVSQGWQGVDVGPVVANETWHHVVWALEPDQNGQGKWYIWLNGALLDTPPKANIGQENTDLRYPVSAPAGQEETENWIGEHPATERDRGFVGRLDDMRMFSRVLSQAEVTALHDKTFACACSLGSYGDPLVACSACSNVSCVAGQFQNVSECLGKSDGCSACSTPAEGAHCPSGSTEDAGMQCEAGYYCAGGSAAPEACTADEGYYCPAGFAPGAGASDRRADGALGGVACPLGYYCAGGTADKVPCTADEGFYCPRAFAPDANVVADGLAGKRCPPGLFCAGDTAGPQPLPPLCDLVRACGSRVVANETCGAVQSTFFKYQDPPTSFAVDASASTCMKTADASSDPNAQWVRVDLGAERLVGTVRFASAGTAADFTVLVAAEDAAEASALNPSAGAALPLVTEACAVTESASGVLEFEAACAPAVKGRFVFILRAAPRQMLEVCDVEIFAHACMPGAELSCPLGYQPAPCTDAQFCPGCVPCAAGSYSDKEGAYECTPCPGIAEYGERPYSPEGSTSVFQCQGDAYLDGTSTLAVAAEGVAFNQTTDSWEIMLEYTKGWKVAVNGLATLFMSKGGDASPSNDATFAARNFPCRVDGSEAANADVSASLEETVCCLQDMRRDYVMTQSFREFTDGLDLVAANDVCDSTAGSDQLVNADHEVVGAGTSFVDSSGALFANDIRVDPVSDDGERFKVRVTIPDVELYKISKSLNPNGELTDSREIFIGLLDMVPTGTRVVDSSSQQISIVLTRTQYGTFATYGEQNIDYDFISFLNARAHKVVDQLPVSSASRRSVWGDQYYAEISFVYDDRLQPANATGAVVVDTVNVKIDGDDMTPCSGEPAELEPGFAAVIGQTCGPKDLPWDEVCPQVSIPDDHFGRLYIPLPDDLDADVIHIEFDLWFTDAGGRSDKMKLAMDLVVEDFVTWCDAGDGSVDLTEKVTSSMIIGTESANPQRLTDFPDNNNDPFSTAAETLQDGLITMVLEITGDEENLEIFFEDVLVVQVNPGSDPSADDLKDDTDFIPTYKYDPDTRDASLILPEALNLSCPEAAFSESFFGCVHKHVLKEEAITNKEWAYLVGSDPVPGTGAQDFMQTMLGTGTASVAARELGRDLEQYLTGAAEQIGTAKKIGLWLNPGHEWGQTVHNSQYSLSEHVIVYVLYGVKSGVDGTVTRRLLQATPSGNSMVTKTLKYEVSAGALVESVMDKVIAIEVEARLALSAEEACLPLASLREICSDRLGAAVAPHASKVERVECVSVQVEKANCDGTRRAAAAPVANVNAVIALAESESAFLDMDAVVASGSVLGMKQAAGKSFPSAHGEPASSEGGGAGKPAELDKATDSGSKTAIIGAAAGAAAGVVLVAFGAWKAASKCGSPADEPLTEVLAVSAGVVEPVNEKERIEQLLFDHQRP